MIKLFSRVKSALSCIKNVLIRDFCNKEFRQDVRFFFGGVLSAFLATMVVLTIATLSDWRDLPMWLAKMGFSTMVGFANGGLMSTWKLLKDAREGDKEDNEVNDKLNNLGR